MEADLAGFHQNRFSFCAWANKINEGRTTVSASGADGAAPSIIHGVS
jgi:hypothetical protein